MSLSEAPRNNTPVDIRGQLAGQELEKTKPPLIVDLENRYVKVGDRFLSFNDTNSWRIIRLFAENIGAEFTPKEIARRIERKDPSSIYAAIRRLNDPKVLGSEYVTNKDSAGIKTGFYRVNEPIVPRDLTKEKLEWDKAHPVVAAKSTPYMPVEKIRPKAKFIIDPGDDEHSRYLSYGVVGGESPPQSVLISDIELGLLRRFLLPDMHSFEAFFKDTRLCYDDGNLETSQEYLKRLGIFNNKLKILQYEIWIKKDEVRRDTFIGIRPIGREEAPVVDDTVAAVPGGKRPKGSSYD